MTDNVNGFISSVFIITEGYIPGGGKWFAGAQNEQCNGNMYCPICGGERRMDIKLKYSPNMDYNTGYLKRVSHKDEDVCAQKTKENLILSLWTFTCVQCDTLFTVVFYQGANGIEMAILPSCNGGIATPNVPKSVAYYLDQAYRSKSVGAKSACMAMYRASLEQLLYEQGYLGGMLNAKIKKLEEDINDGSAKKWARDLDIDYLKYIKELGNGCIHVNDGNILKQEEIDNGLIESVDIVFMALIDMVYEQPKREESRKNLFKKKVKIFERSR